MERKEIIFSILLTITCIFFIVYLVFLVRKNIEPHAYMGDFPPKNYQNKSSREKEHHDIHTAWGDMGYYPNKRNEYEYDGSDSSRTSDIVEAQAEAERIRVEAEAERIRMQSEIAGMKSKAEQLRLQAIESEKTRSKIEQEKYAADADLKLSVINLSSALKELKQSSGDDIEFARANAEEMNTENKMLKQKLVDLETAEAEALAAAAKASADAKAAQEEAAAAAKAQEEADAADKAAADYRNRKCLRTVNVKRLDSAGGWGMNLKFKCGDEPVTIGPGGANKVTSNPLLLAGGMCPTRVDKSNWSKSHLPSNHKEVGDTFAIEVSECLK